MEDMRVTVLGGVGAVGSTAVKILAASRVFSDIVVGDIEIDKAKKLVSELGAKNVSAVKFDALDQRSVKETVKESDVVLNCVGPFYKYGPTIMRATVESGVNYVDICDDFDATEKLLAMDGDAKKWRTSALIGMGSSPGLANVLVRFCADLLLDEVDAIDIYHAHGGEPVEGPAVVKHRLHSMVIGIPVFLDGQFKTVNLFEDSGKALEEEADFPDVGTYRVYAYPHPETITLPRYIKGVKRVTNLGLVLPPAYAELIKGVVRLGLTSEEPVEVGGQRIVPLEFAVAYIISERKKLIRQAGMTEPMGCLKIVVKGRKKGESSAYAFSMSSKGRGMPEGTGVPAALGAILMGLGKIEEKGVFPPEAVVKPMELLGLAQEKIKIGSEAGLPIFVEHTDKSGKTQRTTLEALVRH
jgi:saccharopine dehydrogenase (NAD+, L-lysine-forming)